MPFYKEDISNILRNLNLDLDSKNEFYLNNFSINTEKKFILYLQKDFIPRKVSLFNTSIYYY
jgi:hypothetical protein